MSLGAYGQHMIYIEDTLHYCTTEPVTKFLISEHLQNNINKDKVMNLEGQVAEKSNKVELLNEKLEFAESVIAAQDTVSKTKDEQIDLHEKEKKKRLWKDVGEWFADQWELVTGVTAAAGVGFGVGYLAK